MGSRSSWSWTAPSSTSSTRTPARESAPRRLLPSAPDIGTFRWGVSTSAFQIEGARHADGKGRSIWDTFLEAGRVPKHADLACDHYHRLDEDLDLLAALGVGAYRFSISWTRVIPDGDGTVNSAGLGFYDRLVDGLIARGIEPWPTLYHWDLPQALQDRGGWANREVVDAFARYTETTVARLGDRASNWITHNEPWVAAFLGHLYGEFAPGTRSWETALITAHHILVSHGVATRLIRNLGPGLRVGIALDCRPARPATPEEADRLAATRFDGFRNRWFFDPVFGLGYPEDTMADYLDAGWVDGSPPGFVTDGDMETIATPIDFLGLNYYTTLPVAVGGEYRDEPEGPTGPNPPPGYTEMGWAIDPGGMADYLVHLTDHYGPASIVVTENGASFSDGPDASGRIDDTRRIEYLDAHIRALENATSRGVPVDGYFVWSLMDNIEWTSGFDQRFGLVWVDPDTRRRVPKASYDWFAAVVRPDSPQTRAMLRAGS